jgi:hypothetical protein
MILLFTEESGDLFPMAVMAVFWTVAAVVTHLAVGRSVANKVPRATVLAGSRT